MVRNLVLVVGFYKRYLVSQDPGMIPRRSQQAGLSDHCIEFRHGVVFPNLCNPRLKSVACFYLYEILALIGWI